MDHLFHACFVANENEVCSAVKESNRTTMLQKMTEKAEKMHKMPKSIDYWHVYDYEKALLIHMINNIDYDVFAVGYEMQGRQTIEGIHWDEEVAKAHVEDSIVQYAPYKIFTVDESKHFLALYYEGIDVFSTCILGCFLKFVSQRVGSYYSRMSLYKSPSVSVTNPQVKFKQWWEGCV